MEPLAVQLSPGHFVDPTFVLLIVLGVSLFVAFRGRPAVGRRARFARRTAWLAWGAMWILATPVLGLFLRAWMETRGPDLREALAGRDPEKTALVVLSGGMRTYDREVPWAERLNPASTQRTLTAARVWKEHPMGLVIVAGAPTAKAHAMRELLAALDVPRARVMLERTSWNTRQNARNCAEILRARGMETVVLVTSALHLGRAVRDFNRAGVTVIPVAADIVGRSRLTVDYFIPSTSGLACMSAVVHESLGRLVR